MKKQVDASSYTTSRDTTQGPAGRTTVQVHLLFDRHAKVLHDMKPVCDLFGLRRSLSSGLGVETAAIPAYDLHLRTTP